ncbi:NYN domain-containing protein [Aeromicrobium sp. 50.2.37]|uniref:NYN domain-containing protein n=1 Tax=Aeromicrobium sp. 50.2.37 TaxID=2969305 RepID=UPI00214FD142|nr:NYN domain-containing protein [Aeromicrobium sp. 50.2.37]MCR4512119.1 NYN domain-containing protein [Aeromicrobium sp. 50.2.37]
MPPARIAVLIDADNAPASKIGAILSQVAKSGNAHVRRAYGDWKNSHLKGWESRLQEFAIAPVQQFAYTKGKNASDIAMVIDAMDLLHAGVADGFAIVSSDADFTPLVMRLRQSGAEVLGFGGEKAPKAFQNACSTFYKLETLREDDDTEDDVEDVPGSTEDDAATTKPSASRTRPSQRVDTATLKSDRQLVRMLRTAVDEAADDDGWAVLSQVSDQIRNQSSIQPGNYGYAKFSGLIEAIDLFEVKRDGKSVMVKRKRRGR